MISVVIPTCHRNDLMSKCLDCLAPGKQTLSFDQYEVIVTDDGSKTTAEQLIREKYPWAKWTQGPRKGPAANRNNGAKYAQGEWLAFVDDDCLPDLAWLFSISGAIQQKDLEVVEGKTVIPDKVDNPFRMGVENLHGGVYWSCNLAIKRDMFFKIGAFDEDFLEAGGDDLELAFRIRKNQLKVFFCKNALVFHPVRCITFRGLIWRTLLDRWISLFHFKTNEAELKKTNIFFLVARVVTREYFRLLRRTWYFFSKFDSQFWRTRSFWLIWGWITKPIVLPYLIYWDLRFQKQLLSKK